MGKGPFPGRVAGQRQSLRPLQEAHRSRAAASRSTMGPGVVFGMTISTAIGLFLIPVCYVFVQKFSDKKMDALAPVPTAGDH